MEAVAPRGRCAGRVERGIVLAAGMRAAAGAWLEAEGAAAGVAVGFTGGLLGAGAVAARAGCGFACAALTGFVVAVGARRAGCSSFSVAVAAPGARTRVTRRSLEAACSPRAAPAWRAAADFFAMRCPPVCW